ncbi:UNVERIFIED_CONTAM: hypothetical protein HDU68_005410 [Siphonaria sp. JEL0065]|nr:hypothetical protein HDU68_005410 [Siphonaria sp. JEL0065]
MESSDLALVTSTLLHSLQLSDEAYAEYISQLADDSSMDQSEKAEIIVEFLSDAVESKDIDITTVVTELLSKLDLAKKERQELSQQEKEREKQEQEAAKAAEANSVKPETETEQQPQKKVLSKEEKKARERLLRQYGYEVDEVIENEHGETEFLYSGGGREKASLPEGMQNTNAQRVKEAEQMRRQKLAASHAAEVERNKAARQKQLEDAEKKKKKTVKQEKRRM